MLIRLDKIRAVGDGAEAELSLSLSQGERTQTIKGKVSAAMLSDLGLPSSLRAPLLLERARCEDILRCIKLYAAIKKGMDLLGYAKNTPKALKNNLMRKGFPDDIADDAVAYLCEKGFIREDEEALMFARALAERKKYGANRIRQEMFAKGFSADIIREAMALLDIDFAQICASRLHSMGGASLFETAESRKKYTASLLRYGFSYAEIREALEILKEEESTE